MSKITKFPNERPRLKLKCPQCGGTSFEIHLSQSDPQRTQLLVCLGKYCTWMENLDNDEIECDVD
jgi:hypothetical protein